MNCARGAYKRKAIDTLPKSSRMAYMSENTTTPAVTTTSTSRRVGRPEVAIQWPQGNFTINDLKSTGLSRVGLQVKVQKALENNVLKVVGTDKGSGAKMGRPSKVYATV